MSPRVLSYRLTDACKAFAYSLWRKPQTIIVFPGSLGRSFIFFNRRNAHKGPSAVLNNVRTSLLRNSYPHRIITLNLDVFKLSEKQKKYIRNADRVIIPFWRTEVSELEELLHQSPHAQFFLGPNFSLSINKLDLIAKRHAERFFVLLPSEEIRKYFERRYPNRVNFFKSCFVVPTPVDEEYWCGGIRKRSLVLLYLKGKEFPERSDIQSVLRQRYGRSVKTIKYGAYTQKQYRALLAEARIMIYLGGTESQGLALLESWASNVPTIVRGTANNPKSSTHLKNLKYGGQLSTYAPLMSQYTGRFFTTSEDLFLILDKFELKEIGFCPRKWVQQNLPLSKFTAFLDSV